MNTKTKHTPGRRLKMMVKIMSRNEDIQKEIAQLKADRQAHTPGTNDQGILGWHKLKNEVAQLKADKVELVEAIKQYMEDDCDAHKLKRPVYKYCQTLIAKHSTPTTK